MFVIYFFLTKKTQFSFIYLECWDYEPDNRPIMNQVVTRLKRELSQSDKSNLGKNNSLQEVIHLSNF